MTFITRKPEAVSNNGLFSVSYQYLLPSGVYIDVYGHTMSAEERLSSFTLKGNFREQDLVDFLDYNLSFAINDDGDRIAMYAYRKNAAGKTFNMLIIYEAVVAQQWEHASTIIHLAQYGIEDLLCCFADNGDVVISCPAKGSLSAAFEQAAGLQSAGLSAKLPLCHRQGHDRKWHLVTE